MLSLKHTIYNLITCSKSLKLTYIHTLQQQKLYSTNKRKSTQIFNFIHLILNSKNILQINSRAECILMHYAFPLNKSIKNLPIFSKYFQSYLYTYKKQRSLYLKVYLYQAKNIEYPINVVSLNTIYIIYRIMKSKHPIYIYNQIYKNL